MTSPEIKTLITLACVATLYAFVCEIKISHRARMVRDWLQKERSDLWQELNVFARHWNGGLPGLKLLYRGKVVDLPKFVHEYEQICATEQQLLWGIAVGVVCICLVILGERFWGWHW